MQRTDLWLPFDMPGYHTLLFEAQPTCPDRYNVALFTCVQPSLNLERLDSLKPATFGEPIQFEKGVKLHSLVVRDLAQLTVNLWWQFDQPRTEQDVRFIKVLDEQGEQIAGVDETPGIHEVGSQWIETVRLNLPADLKAGEYRVYAGWYSYPDLTRFGVLSDVEGAQDGLALIDEFSFTP
jgi:hypothetical protein